VKTKRFDERPPREKAGLLAIGAVGLAIIAAAQRDISSRDEAELRGSKTIWRFVSLNALGALAYLRFGRRS
jgi:hypothetical protein